MIQHPKPSRKRAKVGAVALLTLTLVSCGDDATAPCPDVTNTAGVILTSHGHELYRQVGAAQQGALTVASGGLLHGIQCTFVDANAQAIPIANRCGTDSVAVESLDPGVASVSRDAGLRLYFNVSGVAPGSTTLALRLLHENDPSFTALPVPVEITGPVR